MTPKQKIRDHFAAAVPTYDFHATMQRAAAQQLMIAVQDAFGGTPPDTVLEVGCGTGLFTRYLHDIYPHSTLTLNDIATDMVDATASRFPEMQPHLVTADAETTYFPDAPYDLIAGNLVLQWMQDPLMTLSHLWPQTRCLAFSTLCRGTLAAWRVVHEDMQLSTGLQQFLPADDYRDALQELGGSQVIIREQTIDRPFANGLDFIRALKNIGAHTARGGHEPVNLRKVLRRFEQGFTARYHLLYAVVKL